MKYDWPRTISNLAILLGLALVLYELDQNQELALSQAQIDDYASIQSFQNAIMGENIATALVKARSNPSQLTDEDRVVLGAYLSSIVFRIESYEFVSIFNGDFEAPLLYDLRKSFDFEYARVWWERERGFGANWRPGVNRVIDEYLSQNPIL